MKPFGGGREDRGSLAVPRCIKCSRNVLVLVRAACLVLVVATALCSAGVYIDISHSPRSAAGHVDLSPDYCRSGLKLRRSLRVALHSFLLSLGRVGVVEASIIPVATPRILAAANDGEQQQMVEVVVALADPPHSNSQQQQHSRRLILLPIGAKVLLPV
jgi:hypothetical protein